MKYTAFHDNDEFANLTPEEIDLAVRHGMRMRETSLRKGFKNHKGYRPDNKKALRTQCLGVLAEVAACKVLDLPIKLVSEVYNVADLMGIIEVRLIGAEHYGLRVYPGDDPKWRVMGIIIPKGKERVGSYRVPGWCLASEALSNPEWKMAPHGRPPMFCVPQESLRPISTLRDLIK